MQSDRYLRAVLTVIAVCLVWICLRDVTLVNSAHAQADPEVQTISHYVRQIAVGQCQNSKIC
jgi:uncharacterized membrane protein YpjA